MHPSSFYSSYPEFKTAAATSAYQPYFLSSYFIFYEVGFSPITLLRATFQDYQMACGHYTTITSLLTSALVKLPEFICEAAIRKFYESVRHRRMMNSGGLEMINSKGFANIYKKAEYF